MSNFKEAGIIEKYGSGIKRIRQVLANVGTTEPVFEIIGDYFKVILFPITAIPNEGVKALIDLIKNEPGKRTPLFVQKMQTSVKNIERWLKQLKDNNQIEFRGAPKTGGYYLIASKQKEH